MDEVDSIWWTLSAEFGIETYAVCQIEDLKLSLAGLYHVEAFELSDSDLDDGSSSEMSIDGDDNDSMPGLVEVTDQSL